jgi:hypothetical protein
LVIITADECVDLISNTGGLREWAGDVRLAMGMKGNDQLVIMIKGLGKYYSKLKSAQNKEFTAAARAGVAGKDVGGLGMVAGEKLGREQIDMELLRLEMENGAFLVHGMSYLSPSFASTNSQLKRRKTSKIGYSI